MKLMNTGSESEALKVLEKGFAEKKALLEEVGEKLKNHKENNKMDRKYKKVQKAIRRIRGDIAELEEQKAEKKKRCEEVEFLIKTSEQLLEQMNNIVLVHPSAALYQLYRYQTRRIWITKSDEEFFEEISDRTGGVFSADNIFDVKTSMQIIIPEELVKKQVEAKEEFDSIISFCEMALYLKNNKKAGVEISLAHREPLIAKVLKLNRS